MAALLILPCLAHAQGTPQTLQIGYLSNSAGTSALDREFFEAMRIAGWEDGRNIVVHARYSSGDSARFREFAAELVRLNVAAIVAWGTNAVAAAKRATDNIPIIMLTGTDPIAAGLVNGFPRPEANVTGIGLVDGLEGKRLQVLKEAFPQLKRVAVVFNPERPGHQDLLSQSRRAAATLGLDVRAFPVVRPEELKATFVEIKKARAHAVLILTDAMYWAHRADIVRQAVNVGLPTIYPARDFAVVGGLLSYSVNFNDMARRGTVYVSKILKGAKVSDLPLEQPETFELVINMQTAKTMGLKLPDAVLLHADELIR